MAKPNPVLPESADPLGETLHMLRLTGTLYCRGEFSAPFAIEIPELEGVMTFLVVTSGRCWLQVSGAEPRLLEQGNLALIPHGIPHIVSSDPKLPAEPLFDLPIEKISERYESMRHGGGGALTRTMYGVVRFDDVAAQHLLRLLPQTIYIDGWHDDADGWLRSTLRFIASEAASLKPGGETVITRLADVVVIQAIRSWLETSPDADQGWLAAIARPTDRKGIGTDSSRAGTGLDGGITVRRRRDVTFRFLSEIHRTGRCFARPLPDRLAHADRTNTPVGLQ